MFPLSRSPPCPPGTSYPIFSLTPRLYEGAHPPTHHSWLSALAFPYTLASNPLRRKGCSSG